MQFGRGSNTTYNTAQFGGALSGSNCYVNAIKHYTSNNYYKTALSYGAFTTATDTTIEEGTYEMIVNQTSTDTDYSLGFITFRNKNTKAYFGENNKSWIEISSAGRLLSRGIIASGGTFTQTISGNDTTTDDTNYSFKTTVFVGYEASDMTVAGVDGATATINSYNSVTGNVTLTITGTSAALSATITYTLAGDCTISYRKVSN